MQTIHTYQDSLGDWHAKVVENHAILKEFPPAGPGYTTRAEAYQRAVQYIDSRNPLQSTGATPPKPPQAQEHSIVPLITALPDPLPDNSEIYQKKHQSRG